MTLRSPVEQLRRYLISSLGLATPLLLAACGSTPVVSEGDGGVTTDPSGDGSSVDDDDDDDDGTTGVPGTTTAPMPGTTGTTAPDPDTGTDTDDPDPPKWDMPGESPDLPPLGECVITLADGAALSEHPECPIELDDDGVCWSGLYWGCVDLEPGETCEQLCPGGDCIAEWWNCGGDQIFDQPLEVCGPYEIDGMCCSLAEVHEGCGSDGRPFIVDGASRQAALRVLDRKPAPTQVPLPDRVRSQLASRWAAIARAEHASIASFAQFAARLQALGAPASLVAGALTAAADEVRHAEFTLALASQLSGRALEFGPLDTRGAAKPDLSFADTLLACVREGCIGETLAALELATAAQRCEDPELAASLRAIADDEARHAALAWRFVQWGLAREPSLAPRLAALFESLGSSDSRETDSSASERPDERALLRAHGCLPTDERRRVEANGLRELVLPCAHALLAAHAPARLPAHS
jgi:hypothetical protein